MEENLSKKTWIISSAVLFIIWIALSGRMEIKMLVYGLAASVTAGWVFARINGNAKIKPAAFIRYFFWLLGEVGKSSWDVTKVVLSPKMKINPQIIEFDWKYNNRYATALLINSIILTPGTVTVDVLDDEHFIVHALTDSAAASLNEGTMQRRIEEVFW